MGFKPITRNMPVEEPPNILSEDDAAIYRGILGQDGVLNIGSKLKSTVLSNNKVRVGDGVINVDGHIGRNSYADYEDLTIENGTAGQKRNDLIIASFSTTGSGGLDTYVLKVKKGVAGSTGTDPAVTKQDIYAGGKLREYPLYRVKLDGLSIVGVEQLFKVIPTVPELETKYNELNSAMKREITEINYQYYTSATEISNIDMNFKIGNIVHLQCGFKRNDSGKYPVGTGLIHIQNGSHRPKNNLIIPAYIRVGNEWYPHYVYVRTNGEVHQDFSNNTEEVLINGCYPVI